jgi:hypothetical protein
MQQHREPPVGEAPPHHARGEDVAVARWWDISVDPQAFADAVEAGSASLLGVSYVTAYEVSPAQQAELERCRVRLHDAHQHRDKPRTPRSCLACLLHGSAAVVSSSRQLVPAAPDAAGLPLASLQLTLVPAGALPLHGRSPRAGGRSRFRDDCVLASAPACVPVVRLPYPLSRG